MIGGASSNIYISATKEEQHSTDAAPEHYRRPQKVWLLSVEPHKHSIPLVPRHKHETIHFSATQGDTESSYNLGEHSKDGIIGAILVAEHAHQDAEHIRKLLEQELKSQTGSSVPSEILSADGESDHWIRRALHILQEHQVVEAFDVGEFMTFAHVSIICTLTARETASDDECTGIRSKSDRRRCASFSGLSWLAQGQWSVSVSSTDPILFQSHLHHSRRRKCIFRNPPAPRSRTR